MDVALGRTRVREYLLASASVKQRTAQCCAEDICRAASEIADCMRRGGKLLLCGNGGSAADCQHIAAEFVNVLNKQWARPALAAIALTTDSSILTASANDFGFEQIFARQLEALGRRGDALIGISTSGESENVLRAMAMAKRSGIYTVGLTGGHAGRMAAFSEILVSIPSLSTQHIQEAHIAVGHIISELVEFELCSPAANVTGSGTADP